MSPGAADRLPDASRSGTAREGDGPLVDGAAGSAAMWRAIPLLRPLGLLAKNRVVLWILERLYRVFLVARPWMQRRAATLFGRPDTASR